MMNKANGISNIILFFVIALTWSCGIWIILLPSVQDALNVELSSMWAWLGLIGPGLSAIVVSLKENGLTGLKNLFKPLLKWRVPLIYYVFVYFGVIVFYSAASWISVLTYGADDIKSFSWLLENIQAPFFDLTGIGVVLETTIIYTFCEELGWRGYALPKMNGYLTALSAAMIIGIFWTLWHIPLVYLYGSELDVSSAAIYFLHIECMSIFYAWLYFKTDKSLLLVGLFHGATDGIGAYFPLTNSLIGQGPNLPTTILEILIALLMVPYLGNQKPVKNC